MLQALKRMRRVTLPHPAPEHLVPYALGAEDAATAQHVEGCVICRTEIEELQQAAGLLRGPAVLERRTETPDCPDELVLADFVDGRLTPQNRAPVVAHLLTCARCRALVKATSDFATSAAGSTPLERRGWQRWSLPVGLAAAAVLTLLLLPRGRDRESTLREPPLTNTIAPVPLEPRGPVGRVERMVWSSVPNAQRYRVRLYDDQSTVTWQAETTDTIALLDGTVHLSPAATYFWRVEAETEWRRWASSELTEFRVAPQPR
jgi:hypothetical protein